MKGSSVGLVRSMLVTGAAQAAGIIISVVRQKLLALLLGPSGIGLLSIFVNFQSMGIQAAGLGMASSGVRNVASARENREVLEQVRLVLVTAHFAQGLIAFVGIWLVKGQIAEWLFGGSARAMEVGIVGGAIFLGLIASAHTALLQGLRRIGDLARATVLGALAGTVVGLSAVWVKGEGGLVWFVVVQPLGNLVAAWWYVWRLPQTQAPPPTFRQIPQIWLPMARLGVAFMLGGLATACTLLYVRSYISQELGLDAAGQFAAAWGITMTYVGFMLSAMAADYYPRLAEVINDQRASVTLMNNQAQLGLAIGGPVLLLLVGWAPWVIRLLYSSDFEPAIALLQWQSLGNIFKLASWPLGFSLAAAARGKTFLAVQLNFNVIFVVLLVAALPHFGLIAAGPAFAVAYALHFLVLIILVTYVIGFRAARLTRRLFASHVVLCGAILVCAQLLPVFASFFAPAVAIVTGIVGLRVVLAKIGTSGRLSERLTSFFAKVGWPIEAHL